MVVDAGTGTVDMVVVSTGQRGWTGGEFRGHSLGDAGGHAVGICWRIVVTAVASWQLGIASIDGCARAFVIFVMGGMAQCCASCVVRCSGFAGRRVVDPPSATAVAFCRHAVLAGHGHVASTATSPRCGANIVG